MPRARDVRLVVDTNLVVSALLWRGTPHLLLATIDDYPVEFYTSRVLLDELADVLPRKKLARAVQATGDRDLLVLGHHRRIKIVTARRALELVTHKTTQ